MKIIRERMPEIIINKTTQNLLANKLELSLIKIRQTRIRNTRMK